MTQWRTCLFAVALVLSAGAHIAVASFWQEVPKMGAIDNGSGGLVVSLGPAGSAPGGASAAQAKTKAQDNVPMSDNPAPPRSSEPTELVADENIEVSELRDPKSMVRDDPANAAPLASVAAETPNAETISENIEDMIWDVVTAAGPAPVLDVTPTVETRLQDEKPVSRNADASHPAPNSKIATETSRPRPPAKKPTRLMKPAKVTALVRKVLPKPHVLADGKKTQVREIADARLPRQEDRADSKDDTRNAEAASDDQTNQMANLVSGQGGNTGVGGEANAGDGDNTPGGGTPGAQADYFAEVQDWLERHKRYPRRAKLRQLQGVALLRFVVMRDGSITNFAVEESSGHSLLDAEVLKLVVRAQPLPSIPKSMLRPEIELFVPIVFSLN